MTVPERLRTEARIERTENGWSIHLPVRREEVSLEKRTVAGEEVVIRRPDLDATQPLEPTHSRDTLAGTGMEQDPLG